MLIKAEGEYWCLRLNFVSISRRSHLSCQLAIWIVLYQARPKVFALDYPTAFKWKVSSDVLPHGKNLLELNISAGLFFQHSFQHVVSMCDLNIAWQKSFKSFSFDEIVCWSYTSLTFSVTKLIPPLGESKLITCELCDQVIDGGGSGAYCTMQVRLIVDSISICNSGLPRISVIGSETKIYFLF